MISARDVASTGPRSRFVTLQELAFGGIGQSIGLAILAAIVVWPSLFSNGILLGLDIAGASLPWSHLPGIAIPHNATLSDTLAQNYPWRHFIYEALRSGQWPLWNPFILAGHPTFASINEQVFYPPSDLLFAIPAERSFGLLAWFHLTIAGVGMRQFAMLILDDDASACLAAIGLMLSGPVIVWLEYPEFLSTFAWVGFLLYFVERVLRERRPLFAGLGGIVVGLELLGGQAQYSLYLAVIVSAHALARLIGIARSDRQAMVPTIGLLGLLAAIGGGIGSVAYLPSLELTLQSNRSLLDVNQLVATALPLKNLVTFLVPNAFGTPLREDFVGFFNDNEATAYVGLLPIFLVLLLPITRPPRRPIALFGAMAIGTLLLVFGWPPAARVLWAIVPFRYFGLNRLVILLPLVFGLTGAASYAALPTKGSERWRRTAAVLAVAAVLIAALVPIARQEGILTGHDDFARRDLAVAALSAVLATVALVVRIWQPRQSPLRWLGPLVLALDLLAFGAGYNTIVTTNPFAGGATPPLDRVATGPFAARTIGLPIDEWVLEPNLGMLWDIATPDGYVSEYVQHYGTFANRATPVNGEMPSTSLHPGGNYLNFGQALPRYLDLLGVRYVVAPTDPEFPDVIQSGHDAETDLVAGPTSVGQTFQARQNGLNRIDVYPVLSSRGPPGWIALHLKSSPTDPNHIAYVRLEGTAIKAGQPLTFWFKPIPDSAGRELYFYLDAPETAGDSAIRLANQQQPPPAGQQRFENDRPVSGSLAFAAYAAPTTGWPELGSANGLTVYENPDALPRAFVVHRVAPMTDEQFYLGLDRGTIDPGRIAAIGTAPPTNLATSLLAGNAPPLTSVDVLGATFGEVDLRTTLAEPGLLVISNVWYPGWHATVDGQSTSVERVDGVFQGVYLSPGKHTILLRFEPGSLHLGLALASGAVLLAVAAVAVDRRLRR